MVTKGLRQGWEGSPLLQLRFASLRWPSPRSAGSGGPVARHQSPSRAFFWHGCRRLPARVLTIVAMGTPLKIVSSSGITYDRIANVRPGMSVVELKQARQDLWRTFQDDPDVLYYLGQFYRRRVDSGVRA